VVQGFEVGVEVMSKLWVALGMEWFPIGPPVTIQYLPRIFFQLLFQQLKAALFSRAVVESASE